MIVHFTFILKRLNDLCIVPFTYGEFLVILLFLISTMMVRENISATQHIENE